MTQRKCGTCRYFEEGGIAASGWCRHPERQELQHMVLVRKTELACRDGWDHDLWEPKDGSGGTNGMGPRGSGSGTSMNAGGPVSRSGERSPGGADAPRLREGFPDRLGGSAATAVGVREADHATRRDDQDSMFDSDWSPFDQPSPPFSRTRDHEPVDEIRDETFSTRGLRISTRGPAPDRDKEDPGPEEPIEPARSEQSRARSVERRDLNPFNRTGDDFAGRFGVSSETFPQGGREVSGEVEPGSYEPEPAEQSGLTEPFDVMEPETDMAEPSKDLSRETVEPMSTDEEPTEQEEWISDTDDDDDRGSLNVPLSLQQKRCCRTCRDFRPTDGGRRGWCNNPFAFEQRQQVEADDLACHGTYGNWWSPADDWWIERADISHHSTPTPMVDDLIKNGQEPDEKQPRSTEKRRSS